MHLNLCCLFYQDEIQRLSDVVSQLREENSSLNGKLTLGVAPSQQPSSLSDSDRQVVSLLQEKLSEAESLYQKVNEELERNRQVHR